MPSNKFLVSCTKYFSIILFSTSLQASPWLEETQEGKFFFAGFISGFTISSYKGSAEYGLSDSINLGLDSQYTLDKKIFDNKMWLKVKLLEKDHDDFQYILSTTIANNNSISNDGISFNNIDIQLSLGAKLDTLSASLEPSIAVSTNSYSPNMSFSLTYDYSEYSTLLFTKSLLSSNNSWSVGFIKNIISTIDIDCNYYYYETSSSKLKVGVQYRFRP